LIVDEHPISEHNLESRSPGHELSDVNVRLIFVFGLAIIVLGLIVHFTLTAFVRSLARQQAHAVSASRGPSDISLQSSEPPLQEAPAAELAKLRAEEDAKLNSYDWVDRRAGVVRIPIDRAMALVLKKGLPTRPAEKKEEKAKD
jgi:hypothetical protein